jgi:hypothetical protein
VQQTSACCSKRFYPLISLRDGDILVNKINVVFYSLTLNRITYCLISACGSYLSVEQVERIDSFLKRARRYRFTNFYYDFNGLIECTDFKMFTSIQYEQHILSPTKTGDSNFEFEAIT